MLEPRRVAGLQPIARPKLHGSVCHRGQGREDQAAGEQEGDGGLGRFHGGFGSWMEGYRSLMGFGTGPQFLFFRGMGCKMGPMPRWASNLFCRQLKAALNHCRRFRSCGSTWNGPGGFFSKMLFLLLPGCHKGPQLRPPCRKMRESLQLRVRAGIFLSPCV